MGLPVRLPRKSGHPSDEAEAGLGRAERGVEPAPVVPYFDDVEDGSASAARGLKEPAQPPLER